MHYKLLMRNGGATERKVAAKRETMKWIESHVNYSGDDCLTWPFCLRNKQGYGKTQFMGKISSAHVAMCILAHGEKPEGKQLVAHSCGNGHLGCVNPRHLRWSTYLENNQDRILHGRQDYGSRCYQAKLTESDIPKIREMKKTMTYKAIAECYGVSTPTIAQIFRGKSWWYIG
jgi:hypothetical protein